MICFLLHLFYLLYIIYNTNYQHCQQLSANIFGFFQNIWMSDGFSSKNRLVSGDFGSVCGHTSVPRRGNRLPVPLAAPVRAAALLIDTAAWGKASTFFLLNRLFQFAFWYAILFLAIKQGTEKRWQFSHGHVYFLWEKRQIKTV